MGEGADVSVGVGEGQSLVPKAALNAAVAFGVPPSV
jgi:hypothetical protein